MIVRVLDGLAANDNGAVEQAVRKDVRELCRRFPIYQGLK
jgi:glycine hydroxymethyltransferase